MNVSRRHALRQLACASIGMALIPSCMEDKSKGSMLLKHLRISAEEEAMLAELCEIILPKTGTPGAKDISAHLFVLTMVDDCSSADQQQRFKKGMEEFRSLCTKTTGKSLIDCTAEERTSITQAIASASDQEDLMLFLDTVKRRTIQAYTSSEFFLTKVHVYELVPGRYRGCVPA